MLPIFPVGEILLSQKRSKNFYQSGRCSMESFFFRDWHCKTESLANRAKTLLPKVRFLRDMGIIQDKSYFSFVNFQIAGGPTYDTIRLSPDDSYVYAMLAFYPTGIVLLSQRLTHFEPVPIEMNQLVIGERAVWSQLKQLIRNSKDFKLIFKSICSGPNSLTALERLRLIRLKSEQKGLIQVAKDYHYQEWHQRYLNAAE